MEGSPGHAAAPGQQCRGTLRKGAKVIVTGLQSAAQHNGAVGLVTSGAPNSQGRWEVEVKRVLSLKPDNLKVKVSPFGVSLQHGARVHVESLQSAAHFNGASGTVVSNGPNSSGRWDVEVRSTLAFRPENLLVNSDSSQPRQAAYGPLRKGMSVLLTGLKASPEYNGLWGTVVSPRLTVDDRWQIEIMYRRETKVLSLRRTNLIPADEPEPMTAAAWASDEEDEDSEAGPDQSSAAGGFPRHGDAADVAGAETGKHLLPEVDHSQVHYEAAAPAEPFTEHEDIARLSMDEVQHYRDELGIAVSGEEVPRPICAWGHLKLSEPLLEALRARCFSQPTSVQCQVLPCALRGRDVVAVAGTGSGKTLAYALPLLVHTSRQRRSGKKEGPLCLVLCPTRELALQVETILSRFGKGLELRSMALVGGASKQEQCVKLRHGVEVVVCNPGRLIDLVRSKATTLRRVMHFVLDEADRMLDHGFEAQVSSVAQNIRPDRQTLLFSATMPARVQRLASRLLRRPVWITVGEASRVPQCIEEDAVVVSDAEAKWTWLAEHWASLSAVGQLLVFVRTKAAADALLVRLQEAGRAAAALHGDMQQAERSAALASLRRGEVAALVATDVAARGLDIPSIRIVLSFDVAPDIVTHVHRVGRTGRAGVSGKAITLVEHADASGAAVLLRHWRTAGRPVPEELREAAARGSAAGGGPAAKRARS